MSATPPLRAVSELLGLHFDFTAYDAHVDRLGGPARIAVIGMVSRGKSTLVNQLTGIPLMPVGAVGETAADVHVASGEPRFWRKFADGTVEESSASPEAACRSLLRSSARPIREAHFSWPCRLPGGVTLVDTPGIDDARGALDGLDHLDQHWKKSGAVGALALISVPPGLAAADQRLLDAAREFFGRALVVVVKPTDSTMSLEDLHDVAEHITGEVGFAPIVVGHVEQPGNWGMGDLSGVEHAIEYLVSLAGEAVEHSKHAIDDFHALFAVAVKTIDEARLGALEEACGLSDSCPEVVRGALLGRRAELRALGDQRRTAQLAEARRVLDSQAAEFVQYLAKVSPDSTKVAAHLGVIGDLAALAIQGSKVAQTALAPWIHLLSVAQRKDIGLYLDSGGGQARVSAVIQTLVGKFDGANTGSNPVVFLTSETFVARSTCAALDDRELSSLIAVPAPQGLELHVVALIATALKDAPAEQVRRFIEGRPDAQHRPVLEHVYAVRVEAALRAKMTDIGLRSSSESLTGFAALGGNEVPNLIQGAAFLSDDVRSRLEQTLQGIRGESAVKAMRCAESVRTTLTRDRITGRIETIASVIRGLRPAIDWLHHELGTSASARMAADFAPNGFLSELDRRVESEIKVAERKNATVARRKDVLYYASFVVGISVLFLSGQAKGRPWLGPLIAVTVLASIATWLATRERPTGGRGWLHYYIEPAWPRFSDDGLTLIVGRAIAKSPQRSRQIRVAVAVAVVALGAVAAVLVVRALPVSSPDQGVAVRATLAPTTTRQPTTATVPALTTPRTTSTTSTTTTSTTTTTTAPVGTVASTTVLPSVTATTIAPLTVDPYFTALTRWNLAGALAMQQGAYGGGPAWAYSRHLEQTFRANPAAARATYRPTGVDSGNFCLGSLCFAIGNIVRVGSQVDSFSVDGVPLSSIVKAWTLGVAPRACLVSGSVSDCPGSQGEVVSLTSLYTIGSSTWVTFEVDCGAQFFSSAEPTLVRLAASGASAGAVAIARSSAIKPGTVTIWLAKFKGISAVDASNFTVTLKVSGTNYDWNMSIP